MNSYEVAVKALQDINEEHGDVWKLPPFRHSLMFALCEFGESVDAELRTYPEYMRNRELEGDFAEERYLEICDGIMMLMKALMSVSYSFEFRTEAYLMVDRTLDQEVYSTVRSIAEILGFMASLSSPSMLAFKIEYMIVDLITVVEKEKGDGYVGKTIAEKVEKTRIKIMKKKMEMTNA